MSKLIKNRDPLENWHVLQEIVEQQHPLKSTITFLAIRFKTANRATALELQTHKPTLSSKGPAPPKGPPSRCDPLFGRLKLFLLSLRHVISVNHCVHSGGRSYSLIIPISL